MLALAQSRRKPKSQHRQQQRRDDEDRRPAGAVDQQRAAGDAERLADIKRGREECDRGAARLRRHLRRVGLQRVVQHVEAEPDRGDAERRDPPGRREGERQIGGADQKPAERRQADLSETPDQARHQRRIGQPADPEHRDDQPDQGERQAEPQMQIRAHIGERAPHQCRLDDRREQHGARPRVCQHDANSRRRSRASVLRRSAPDAWWD